MNCPFCLSEENKVVDKRDSGNLTKRRRECLKCGKRFTTFEKVKDIDLMIVKKDGRREQFLRDKMQAGLKRACEKRPISTEMIEKMIDEIETRIRKEDKEVPSKLIGELMMQKLS